MNRYMISCDWGTSSFRLRLVDLSDHRIIEAISSGDGTARVFESWQALDQAAREDRESFFLRRLGQYLEELEERASPPLKDIPVVVSGMAGSSIGIRELPYALLPFSVDGRDAVVERIKPGGRFPYNLWLVSGVRGDADVMRGEETQMVGLASLDSRVTEAALCIFPGTHSKHLRIKKGKVIAFHTFMTGELFELMSRHSILKASVSDTPTELPAGPEADAFCRGVLQSGASALLHSLFTVRVNRLFDEVTLEENRAYLSGLLIGSELRSIPKTPELPLVLCSGSNVYPSYKLAMETLSWQEETTLITPERMDRAVVEGQIKILEHHNHEII